MPVTALLMLSLAQLSTGLLSPTEFHLATMPGWPLKTLSLSRCLSNSVLLTPAPDHPPPHPQPHIAEPEEPNPADPLKCLIHAQCLACHSWIVPRSPGAVRARLAVAGVGNQAR
ncbi:hypothetical protein PTTG_06973 [Puccinia triticina 1-1 BBBD Race 1]|uniref:Secreted protein n=1 Tax=Puccinia triticina (isolate 1-1 / race 1 (BBBD)) TaxID=630390 RepID=A0A180G897_PUCT1|nr:hypothetical protein PTTG_06973 [Puccinia triticina 1-1 BBBD Race 1]